MAELNWIIIAPLMTNVQSENDMVSFPLLLQELGGNATLIFYGTEEGNEGKTAYVERRRPDFSKIGRAHV